MWSADGRAAGAMSRVSLLRRIRPSAEPRLLRRARSRVDSRPQAARPTTAREGRRGSVVRARPSRGTIQRRRCFRSRGTKSEGRRVRPRRTDRAGHGASARLPGGKGPLSVPGRPEASRRLFPRPPPQRRPSLCCAPHHRRDPPHRRRLHHGRHSGSVLPRSPEVGGSIGRSPHMGPYAPPPAFRVTTGSAVRPPL